MWVGVVSLFPEMMRIISEQGVLARAIERGVLQFDLQNPRDFAEDRHSTVDDRPYGGGPGMVMKVAPLLAAIEASKAQAPKASTESARVVYLSPQGATLNQASVQRLASEPALVLVAGRYEGIDERLMDEVIDEELSIGDYVLTGGELPVMVVMDAVARCLPGTLGNPESADYESHRNGLLDCPHYTRPDSVLGRQVPNVLLSGDHEAIRRWRLGESLRRTYERRPDMLARRSLSVEERQLLGEHFEQARLENEE
jgi:tRNA (guanine37-N1)-methyltransferase